jgi:hypothetical protein
VTTDLADRGQLILISGDRNTKSVPACLRTLSASSAADRVRISVRSLRAHRKRILGNGRCFYTRLSMEPLGEADQPRHGLNQKLPPQ